jgi:membrane protease YdiL (CAAX protease family)
MTTILAAAGSAILVLLAGSLPWAGFGRISGLGAWNLRVGTLVPWAIVPMAIYLWVYFSFIGGRWGGPNAEVRRRNLLANRLSRSVWRAAVAAGLLGFGAILALLAVVARLIHLPPGAPIRTPPGMPVATMGVLLAMQSVVAGISEESAFRGYMQSIIGRRYGVTAAIVISGVLFGVLHFPNHPGDVVLMLPYYVAVSAVYGGLTWAANSILPALVLHVGGDIAVLMRWWLTGRPEWQIGLVDPPLVWDSGVDVPFVLAALVAVILIAATAAAYHWVHGTRPGPTASTSNNYQASP